MDQQFIFRNMYVCIYKFIDACNEGEWGGVWWRVGGGREGENVAVKLQSQT